MFIFGGYEGENRLNDFHYFILAHEEDQSSENTLREDLSNYVNNELFSDIDLVFETKES